MVGPDKPAMPGQHATVNTIYTCTNVRVLSQISVSSYYGTAEKRSDTDTHTLVFLGRSSLSQWDTQLIQPQSPTNINCHSDRCSIFNMNAKRSAYSTPLRPWIATVNTRQH
jgi:hypothetical protein